jgi:hypothetical protein
MTVQSDRALYTPEMEHAEREMEARADYALSVGRRVQEQTEKLSDKLGPPEPPTDEDVERIRKFILGHAMTEQWRHVVERINRGELTWRGIVEGLAYGTLDRGVSAAFASLSRVPAVSMEELVQSGVFPADQIPRPDGEDKGQDKEETPAQAQAQAQAQATPPAGGRRRPRPDDEDEWFDQDPIGRVTR